MRLALLVATAFRVSVHQKLCRHHQPRWPSQPHQRWGLSDIYNNDALTNLDGLANLTSVGGYLYIFNNAPSPTSMA